MRSTVQELFGSVTGVDFVNINSFRRQVSQTYHGVHVRSLQVREGNWESGMVLELRVAAREQKSYSDPVYGKVTLTPFNPITGAHFRDSLRMSFAKSSGVPPIRSKPCTLSALFTAGSLRIALVSVLSL